MGRGPSFNDGISVGALTRELNDHYTKLVCFHRGKAIYSRHNTKSDRRYKPVPPRKLSENVILLELAHPNLVSIARDSSPFVYISSYQYHLLHTFETDTMTFQPTLADDLVKYGDCMFYDIGGIHKGEMSVKAWEYGTKKNFVTKARLPDSHVNDDPLYEVRIAMERLSKRNRELETKERELQKALEAQKGEILTMQEIINSKSKI